MTKKDKIQLFEDRKVRTVWDEEQEKWYFSIVDVVEILTDSVDPKQYIKKMKTRDPELGSNWGTICTLVDMKGKDGRMHEQMSAVWRRLPASSWKARPESLPFPLRRQASICFRLKMLQKNSEMNTRTTKIEWTDKTWNPITGCTKYAMRQNILLVLRPMESKNARDTERAAARMKKYCFQVVRKSIMPANALSPRFSVLNGQI